VVIGIFEIVEKSYRDHFSHLAHKKMDFRKPLD